MLVDRSRHFAIEQHMATVGAIDFVFKMKWRMFDNIYPQKTNKRAQNYML